jgi:hypothetical protein
MDKDGENAVFDTRNKRATGLRYAPNQFILGTRILPKKGASASELIFDFGVRPFLVYSPQSEVTGRTRVATVDSGLGTVDFIFFFIFNFYWPNYLVLCQ